MVNRKIILTVQEAINYFNAFSESDNSVHSFIEIRQSGTLTDEDINKKNFFKQKKNTPADVCGLVEAFTHKLSDASDEATIASVLSTSKAQPNLKRKRKS